MFDAAQQTVFKINTKAKTKIYDFIDNVIKWKKIYKNFNHIELAKAVIEDSGYLDYLKLKKKNSNNPENLSRIENINEFIESLNDLRI